MIENDGATAQHATAVSQDVRPHAYPMSFGSIRAVSIFRAVCFPD